MYPYDYYQANDLDYSAAYETEDPSSYQSQLIWWGGFQPWWGFRPWWGVRPWWGFRPWCGWRPWC